MNKESIYWKWKSLIIDFGNIIDEKNDYGEYIKKKDMVFAFLGTPDEEIHEWHNGKYSSEYNEAFRYAKQLNLIEEYIDYDDLLYEKEQELDKYKNIIDELEKGFFDIRQLTFSKYNSNEWNNCLSFNDDIKPLLDKLQKLKGSDN